MAEGDVQENPKEECRRKLRILTLVSMVRRSLLLQVVKMKRQLR